MTADATPLHVEEDYATSETGAAMNKPNEKSNTRNTKVGTNNLLNIIGYLVYLVTSYLGGVAGWFGGVSNAELSAQYQTLITPNASYFVYIWGVIFLFEGFFAVAQLLPRFREQPLVQGGIGIWFFLACAAQTAWTITFGYELMIYAFVAMFALLVALLNILRKQWNVVSEEEKKTNTAVRLGEIYIEEAQNDNTAKPPRLGYWLLRFPFAVHAGWISLATPLMLSVLLVNQGATAQYELWVAVISLPLIFGGCMG